jgi:hypothetical protein
MQFFAKAVLTGFALSMGAAIFRKVAKQLGLDDSKEDKDQSSNVTTRDAATDPGLQHELR